MIYHISILNRNNRHLLNNCHVHCAMHITTSNLTPPPPALWQIHCDETKVERGNHSGSHTHLQGCWNLKFGNQVFLALLEEQRSVNSLLTYIGFVCMGKSHPLESCFQRLHKKEMGQKQSPRGHP